MSKPSNGAMMSSDAHVSNSLELLLGREHADIFYLKKGDISNVLSQALAETYRVQPNDPVQFFSRYLLNQVNILN